MEVQVGADHLTEDEELRIIWVKHPPSATAWIQHKPRNWSKAEIISLETAYSSAKGTGSAPIYFLTEVMRSR